MVYHILNIFSGDEYTAKQADAIYIRVEYTECVKQFARLNQVNRRNVTRALFYKCD